MSRPVWMENALCQQVDPALFFPEAYEFTAAKVAKGVCVSCQVQPECLEFALADRSLDGIWGGLTVRERRQLRRTAA